MTAHISQSLPLYIIYKGTSEISKCKTTEPIFIKKLIVIDTSMKVYSPKSLLNQQVMAKVRYRVREFIHYVDFTTYLRRVDGTGIRGAF